MSGCEEPSINYLITATVTMEHCGSCPADPRLLPAPSEI